MSELSELERRLSAALDRIRLGAEALIAREARAGAGSPAAGADEAGEAARDEEIAALRAALEEERQASARLRERLEAAEALRPTADGATPAAGPAAGVAAGPAEAGEALAREVTELRDLLEATQLRNRHLKRRLEELRAALARLREAAADGHVDADLINQAMATELEGLRALREADRQELDALIDELRPLVEEGADA